MSEVSIPLLRPPYPSRSPMVFGRVTDPGMCERHQRVYGRTHAVLPPAEALRLRNAIVFGKGFIRDASGELLRFSLRRPNHQPDVPNEVTKTIAGQTVALLRKPGDSNYGHWLVEILPRVLELRATFPDADLKFGVPSGPINMRTTRNYTLGFLGVTPDQIIPLAGHATLVEDLVLVTSNSIHNHTHHHEGVNAVAELGRRAAATGRGPKRLFVRRVSRKRLLLNENELAAIAEDWGFTVISPEKLSAKQQIEAFADAQIIVGATGAAMTNAMWAAPGCHVACLTPNTGSDHFFFDLSTIRGQRHATIFGQSVGEGVHADFHVKPTDFLRWLRCVTNPIWRLSHLAMRPFSDDFRVERPSRFFARTSMPK